MANSLCARTVLTGLVAGAAMLGANASAVNAQRYHHSYGDRGYVVAESRYGKGTVAGAVRYGRVGPQVRLPRGTWIDCERSCSETLRRATVDFWESNGPQAKDHGPGYLSWSWRRY